MALWGAMTVLSVGHAAHRKTSPPVVDSSRETAGVDGYSSNELEEARQALHEAYRRKYTAYIGKFRRLQVLVAAEDWAVTQRSGKTYVYNHGENVGPGHQFHVEFSEGSLHLVVNATGKPVASVELPKAESVSASGDLGKGRKSDAPVQDSVTILDGSRNRRLSALPGPVSVKTATSPDRPQESAFPNFLPPQVKVFDTPLGHAMDFLVRGSTLNVEISPEDATTNLDQFQVNGTLPLVMKELAKKTSFFITRHGDNVVVSRRKSFLVVPDKEMDLKSLVSALRGFGAADVREVEGGIQFEADQPTARRITDWIEGYRS